MGDVGSEGYGIVRIATDEMCVWWEYLVIETKT